MKQPIKRAAGMLLLLALVLGLLPMRGSAIKARPESWVKNNTADFYEWIQADGMNDIPNDGDWHRIMLIFQWDTGYNQMHYVNLDWTNYHEEDSYGQIVYNYYKTAASINSPYIDGASSRFFTPDHCKTLFIKRVGFDDYYQNPIVIMRMATETGEMGKYLGLTKRYACSLLNSGLELVDSESEAYQLNMVTPDAPYNGHNADADAGSVFFFNRESPYWGLCDAGVSTWDYSVKLHEGAFGLRYKSGTHPYSIYCRYKMYLGTKYTSSYVESNLIVRAGQTEIISGLTYLNTKITVEKGGTLAISGTLLGDGEINNQGTIVINRDATFGYRNTAWETGIKVRCSNGGSLVVMEGAKVALPGGLVLTEGADCQNFGEMVLYNGLCMTDSSFTNHETGLLQLGYRYGSDELRLSENRPIVSQITYEENGKTYKGALPRVYHGNDYVGTSLLRDEIAMIDRNSDVLNSGVIDLNTVVYAGKGENWCTKVNTKGSYYAGTVEPQVGLRNSYEQMWRINSAFEALNLGKWQAKYDVEKQYILWQ